MREYIVIGGFLFNSTPLDFILEKLSNVRFVDINILDKIDTLEDILQQVHEIVLNVPDSSKISLIGYSIGGLIALKYANDYPEYIDKIVLINSSPNFLENDTWQGIKPQEFNRLVKRLDTMHLDEFKRYFTQLVAHPQQINIENYATYFDNALNKSKLLILLKIIKTTNFTDIISKYNMSNLQHKLLMIYSQHDILVPWNKLNAHQVMLLNSTHLELQQHSELLTEILQDIC
jgi:pimeloyl-ACP methyl ester carboxylesterase